MSAFWGGSAVGRLLAWSPLGSMGWQGLEEATALPRVVLLDGPDCRSKAVSALVGREMMMYMRGFALL